MSGWVVSVEVADQILARLARLFITGGGGSPSYGSLTSVILQITSTPVLVEKNYIQEFLACVIDVKLKHEDRTLKRSN